MTTTWSRRGRFIVLVSKLAEPIAHATIGLDRLAILQLKRSIVGKPVTISIFRSITV